MSDKKVWFVTGAGRGMGVDIAKAALIVLLVGPDQSANGQLIPPLRGNRDIPSLTAFALRQRW